MKKILIVNRGEITARIIKTCESLGIETVVIYSDADANLPYVKKATKAYRVGEAPVQKSYLNVDEIIRIAKEERVDAIHPGYGFLSENTAFANKIEKEGIIFIGPSSDVIAMMGDKVAAREAMKRANVPVVPGSEQTLSTVEEAVEFSRSIGYPVMLKASGGGGGIGMVRCNNDEELQKAYLSTKARAKAYFGNDELFVEKLITNARHIEVQVFGDKQGNVVHLFERDCSVQRRNQKVIEETPSPFLSEEVTAQICETAVQAARSVGYYNAGTVEFIVDESENFYFLEMNTRLQVEHPITEQVTGVDLVKWQILVAQDEALPLKQEEIMRKNHSMEFRVYAEDPVTFLPSPGTISTFNLLEGDGVRVDSGYGNQNTVTPFYDPMIAKVIITGSSRSEVIEKANAYFETRSVEGLKTNIPLFKEILKDERFIAGQYDTSFLSTSLVKG
ncbi:acetyl-CoA carboxylase biotin carboxylase subunit [Bacillus sp. CGMCC 1.16541]|uniref:acetyl-CoA carboxylase biotin carboxylase subunit n=1 Tax=Bacillus sp. CGMCC 1.16541 TaxID=2185143 RepID=UPI000D73D5B8|nr:acetyl-CoA carboxylase biotin carboxylase subunit [Bacillus sp. CGMCC 1.16541]